MHLYVWEPCSLYIYRRGSVGGRRKEEEREEGASAHPRAVVDAFVLEILGLPERSL